MVDGESELLEQIFVLPSFSLTCIPNKCNRHCRNKQTQTDKQTDTDTDRQTQTERHRQTDRETQTSW